MGFNSGLKRFKYCDRRGKNVQFHPSPILNLLGIVMSFAFNSIYNFKFDFIQDVSTLKLCKHYLCLLLQFQIFH
jgi:hypothetical protein